MKKLVIMCIAILCIAFIAFSQESEKRVIVKIGKRSFTLKDFEDYLNQSRISKNTFESLNPEIKKRFLDQFVREKLFYAAAKDAKTELTQEQVKNLERLTTMYIIRNYVDRFIQENPVTETEIKAAYDKNPQEYQTPERRKLRHILVPTEEKAKEILQQLKNGASFEELASQNNTDATKQRGGDLGWAQKGVFVKEFENVAFSLKKGETSDIVKTQFGYHIIRVDDITPAQQRSFQEVSQDIKRKLEQQKVENFEQQLKKKYKVQIDYSITEKQAEKK